MSGVVAALRLLSGQEQQQEQQQQQPPVAGAMEPQQADEAEPSREQDLSQQLQRQTDKVRALSTNLQQLERELKQARKLERKLEQVRDQLRQEQLDKQELVQQLLVAQHQLLLKQDQLDEVQAAAGAQPSPPPTIGGFSSRPSPFKAATPTQALKQQQQQQDMGEASGEDESTADAAAAAAPRRHVVAYIGGRTMKPSDRKLLPADVDQIRFFGSPRDTGMGDWKRLEAALKVGSIDAVYATTRWSGHCFTGSAARLCEDRGIPFYLLGAGEKARRKGEWEEAASGSDLEAAAWESC